MKFLKTYFKQDERKTQNNQAREYTICFLMYTLYKKETTHIKKKKFT